MVRPMYRSHSSAREMRRLPGNTVTIHYRRHRPHIAHCCVTGAELHGVPRLRPAKVGKLPRSSRRPNRPYGGKVSPQVLAAAIRDKIVNENLIEEDSE